MVLIAPTSPPTSPSLGLEGGTELPHSQGDQEGKVSLDQVDAPPSPALDEALVLPSWISPSFSHCHQTLSQFLATHSEREPSVLPLYDFDRYGMQLLSKSPSTWPLTDSLDIPAGGELNIFVHNGVGRGKGSGRTKISGDAATGDGSTPMPRRCPQDHKLSAPGSPWSEESFLADSRAVAEKALTIRHAQAYKDGNHRTATLTLFVYLWKAGYDTQDLDPLDIFLLIAPEQEHPTAVVDLAQLVRKHTRRGVMSLESQRIVADRVKSLPVIISALFVMREWIGTASQATYSMIPGTTRWERQQPALGSFETHQRRVRRIKESTVDKVRGLYGLTRRLSARLDSQPVVYGKPPALQ